MPVADHGGGAAERARLTRGICVGRSAAHRRGRLRDNHTVLGTEGTSFCIGQTVRHQPLGLIFASRTNLHAFGGWKLTQRSQRSVALGRVLIVGGCPTDLLPAPWICDTAVAAAAHTERNRRAGEHHST